MSLGIALAGGGLKGLAYIGVFKALEELNIRPEFLSGTSSGSVFATMYALRCTPEEMKEKALMYYKMITKIKKGPIFKAGYTYLTSGVARLEGLIPGENIENLVKIVTEEKKKTNMNELDISYAIATVDTISTKECIFLSKDYKLKNKDIDYVYNAPIAKATRASMSFPGIFTPCQYEKYNFIDGGTKDNLPVGVLKDMGATKTIGISFRIDDYEPKEDIFGILLRTVDIFSLKDVRKAQEDSDLAIEIDASGTSLLEIDDIDKVINTGYNTIMQNKEKILALLDEQTVKN
jgi:NTE family protein